MVAQVMINSKKGMNFIIFIKLKKTGLFFVLIMALNFMAKMKKIKNMKLFILIYLIMKIFNPLKILMK